MAEKDELAEQMLLEKINMQHENEKMKKTSDENKKKVAQVIEESSILQSRW